MIKTFNIGYQCLFLCCILSRLTSIRARTFLTPMQARLSTVQFISPSRRSLFTDSVPWLVVHFRFANGPGLVTSRFHSEETISLFVFQILDWSLKTSKNRLDFGHRDRQPFKERLVNVADTFAILRRIIKKYIAIIRMKHVPNKKVNLSIK
jgi:hypothetical protein